MYQARDRSSEMGSLVEHRDGLNKYLRDWMSRQDRIIEGILSSPERSKGDATSGARTAGMSVFDGVGKPSVEFLAEGHRMPPQDGRKSRGYSVGSKCDSKTLAQVRCSKVKKWSMNDKELMNRAHTNDPPSGVSSEEVIEDLRHGHVRRLVLSKQFEISGAVAIVLNAVFVGIQVEASSRTRSNEQPYLSQIAHLIFCVLFSAELFLRLLADFPTFFFRAHRDWVWNLFDVVIVVLSILEAIIYYMRIFENITFLLLVRIARMIRLVRFIRRGSFFRELRAMVFMIVHTLKSLVWSMVLLFMLMYIFSLVLTQAVANFLILHSDGDIGDDPSAPSLISRSGLEKFFGSLGHSMFTLLQSLTGGVSWREPVGLLREVSAAYEFIFVVFIVFTLFAMLNVITGFFCENARDMAARDREHVIQEKLQDRERYMKEMHAFFKELDQNGDETLSYHELEASLESENVRAYLSSLQIDVTRVWDVFKLLDEDESGSIDMQEFADGCLRLRGEAKSIDIAFIKFELAKLERKLQYFMAFVESQFEKVIIGERKILTHTQRFQHVPQDDILSRQFRCNAQI